MASVFGVSLISINPTVGRDIYVARSSVHQDGQRSLWQSPVHSHEELCAFNSRTFQWLFRSKNYKYNSFGGALSHGVKEEKIKRSVIQVRERQEIFRDNSLHSRQPS